MFEEIINTTGDDLMNTFGDGHCDGDSILNIEMCGYDAGDCYNCMVYEAPLDRSFNISRLGDGTCDGGIYMEEGCYEDNGDCEGESGPSICFFSFYYKAIFLVLVLC